MMVNEDVSVPSTFVSLAEEIIIEGDGASQAQVAVGVTNLTQPAREVLAGIAALDEAGDTKVADEDVASRRESEIEDRAPLEFVAPMVPMAVQASSGIDDPWALEVSGIELIYPPGDSTEYNSANQEVMIEPEIHLLYSLTFNRSCVEVSS